jgi:hypothetical protein
MFYGIPAAAADVASESVFGRHDWTMYPAMPLVPPPRTTLNSPPMGQPAIDPRLAQPRLDAPVRQPSMDPPPGRHAAPPR